MTTPDTLASLIAKWRNDAKRTDWPTDGVFLTPQMCADQLEAALDALVEQLNESADELEIFAKAKSSQLCDLGNPVDESYKKRWSPHINKALELVNKLRVVTELRGRGASEKP